VVEEEQDPELRYPYIRKYDERHQEWRDVFEGDEDLRKYVQKTCVEMVGERSAKVRPIDGAWQNDKVSDEFARRFRFIFVFFLNILLHDLTS